MIKPTPIPLYIFDIDGTVANLAHRLHYINPPTDTSHTRYNGFEPNWEKFFTDVAWDDPILPTIQTLEIIQENAEIRFFTGRDETTREDTLWWIDTFIDLIEPPHIIMREHDDTRSDVIVKREMYEAMLDYDKKRLVAIFEDRRKVVDMWRELGIMCYQVEPGEF